jgi:hypothetical protein
MVDLSTGDVDSALHVYNVKHITIYIYIYIYIYIAADIKRGGS